MANGELFIDGLDHDTADAGVPIASLPEISGVSGIVTDFDIIWGGDGLPPSDPSIGLQGFPYPGVAGANTTGTDSLGAIGVVKSFTIGANDTEWNTSAGLLVLEDGFWASSVRVFISDVIGTRRVRIYTVVLESSDLTESLSNSPENLVDSVPSWDPVEEKGNVTLSWDYDNLGENPDGFAILRDDTVTPPSPDGNRIVGTIPFSSGTPDPSNPDITSYNYTNYFFAVGSYSYTIISYKYGTPNVKSPPSSPPVVVTVSGDSPDINITSDLNIDIALASTIILIVDPSGIYTLVPDQFYDRLYTHGDPEYVDVKIPDPFAKFSFVGK